MVTIMKRLLVKAKNVSQVDTDLEVSNEIRLTKQSAIWKQSAELQENGETYHCLIRVILFQ
jgi:hypothetical protein